MRILICDDHAVVRAGIRLILEQEAGFEIVGEAASGEELIAEASRLRPDIVITDLSMPGLGGLEALPRVRQAAPDAKILILTVHEDEAYFFRALEAGAAGYVLKGASAEEFLAALRLVVGGGVPIPHTLAQHLLADYADRTKDSPPPHHAQLSPREREVLSLVAEGRTNKEIAGRLSISVRTVERYRASIMNKLGLHNRAELVAYAVRRGLLGG
jgi:two-component system response regulator NreC